MKKAKLMLSAIAIFAVVGTAFAFKANRFATHFIYTGALGGGVCTAKLEGAAISNGTANRAASLVSKTTGCADQFTVATSND
jgi:hypothetical protein